MRISRLALILVTAIGVAGCGTSGSPSPQAAFDRAAAAAAKNDWKTVFECIDPQKSDQTLFAITFAAALGSMVDKNAETEFKAICNRHGVIDMKGRPAVPVNDPAKMEQAAHEMFVKVSDKGACFADIMAFLSKRPGSEISKAFSGTLKDVKEPGEMATATVTDAGGKSRPIRFVKRPSGWYLDPTMN